MIWIVEDDPRIALLIHMTVQKIGHDTCRFQDASELERALKSRDRLPDLMLLDLMLRAKGGFEVLKEWKAEKRTRAVPVIIISARAAEGDKVRGLELGAEDYVTKPFGVRELQARVQNALRRIPSVPKHLVFGLLTLIPDSREVRLNGKRIDLTGMEFDLLYYLARFPGAAVSREELLREVWGYVGGGDSSRTVDSHIKTLRQKLGDPVDEPRLIQTVRGTGYRFIAGEQP